MSEGEITLGNAMKARAGHQPADTDLYALVSAHADALFSFALALTGDYDASCDCTQHAYMKAYEHLRKGKIINRSWLYTVTRNAAVDWLRHRQRSHTSSVDLDTLPSESLDRLASTASLREALGSLKAEDREILYLFVVDGFRAAEIGDMLGLSADAVRMRLYRARQQLRDVYGGRS